VPAGRRSRWGWHQLSNDAARRLVVEAGVRAGDLVLDIGAGTGSITAPLVAAGARVVAFELHHGRAHALRERFAHDPVIVVQADAADLRLPRRPFRVVANPPFAVTSPLLRRLLARGSRLLTADLVLGRPAAVRWAGGELRGARRWMTTFDASVTRTIPRSAFAPRPSVDAVVLRIERV
jgi:23S rRNA (adenine-N6)-dimethyltransferase